MYPHVYIRGTGDGDRKDEGPKCRTHRHRVINTKRQLYCVVKTFYKINLRKPKPSKTGNKRHQNRRPQQSTIGGEKNSSGGHPPGSIAKTVQETDCVGGGGEAGGVVEQAVARQPQAVG